MARWTFEPGVAMFHGGQAEPVYQFGKRVGTHYPYKVRIVLGGDYIVIDVDDDDRSYTSGSSTTATIPLAVIQRLIREYETKKA